MTRDISPEAVSDLLDGHARACVAFATPQGPETHPAAVRLEGDRCVVGVDLGLSPLPGIGDEVVVLIDDGVHWFDLRAIYARGEVVPTPTSAALSRDRRLFTVVPSKVVAWDYGQLRPADDAA